MADSEGTEEFEFKLYKKNGDAIETLEGYSGFATAEYSTGDKYEGNFVEGVN